MNWLHPLAICALLSTTKVAGSFFAAPSQPKRSASTLWSESQEFNNETEIYATLSDRYNARWNAMFERLKDYKEKYGDCLVPQRFEEDPKLGLWVTNQRRQATLDEKTKIERHAKLDSIGFVWRVRRCGTQDKPWNDMFEKLKNYKSIHGHCLVPNRYKDDPKLGRWVMRQRELYASTNFQPDRKEKLESIGFVWVTGETYTNYEQYWGEMFERLRAYYQKNGVCWVPKIFPEDPQLGNWCGNQRIRKSKLAAKHRERLDSIGFVWKQR